MPQEHKIGHTDILCAITLGASVAAIATVAAGGVHMMLLGWREGWTVIGGWSSVGHLLLNLLTAFLMWGPIAALLGASAWWLLHRSGVRGAPVSMAVGASLPLLLVATIIGFSGMEKQREGTGAVAPDDGFIEYWSAPVIMAAAGSGAAGGYAAWWCLYRRKRSEIARAITR